MEKRQLMVSDTVDNEVEFCRVYDMEAKEKVEKILLANGISYCCRFEDKGILQRVFSMNPGGKTVCIFRIHDQEVSRAKKLVEAVLDESRIKRRDGKWYGKK